MLKKSDIKNVLSVGLKLFLITAISAMLLAVLNDVTAPIIAQNTKNKQEESMRQVLNQAEDFDRIVLLDYEEAVGEIYKGLNSNCEIIGYAVMTSSNGYGGEISLAVGVDNELNVTGVDVISHSETPGLGANCTNIEFMNQFVNKTIGVEVVKTGAKDNQIDAITSATITSKAVTSGVNTAISAVKVVKEAEYSETK